MTTGIDEANRWREYHEDGVRRCPDHDEVLNIVGACPRCPCPYCGEDREQSDGDCRCREIEAEWDHGIDDDPWPGSGSL